MTTLEKITLNYEEHEDQTNLFTKYHTRFACTIKYNKKSYKFEYQCNTTHDEPNVEDCMYALINDMTSFEYCEDAFDFMNEFGYDDPMKAKKAYKACERTSKALHRLFTNEELEELEEYFYEF